MNHTVYANAIAGAGIGSAGLDASALGQINMVRPPSLEQKLDYLQRGVERLSNIRRRLFEIAERVESRPPVPETGSATPTPSDLNGRFGQVIGFAHANLDEMETLVSRIEDSLFDQKAQAQSSVEARR